MSHKLFFALVLIFIVSLTDSFACSIQVDENAQKNELIAHAVSRADLSIVSVSGVSISGFNQSFEDEGPLGSCPNYHIVSARVSFTHKKNLLESCSYAMTVTVRNYMGETLPEEVGLQEITFTDIEAACSTSRVQLPRKIVLKKKKIIRFPIPR